MVVAGPYDDRAVGDARLIDRIQDLTCAVVELGEVSESCFFLASNSCSVRIPGPSTSNSILPLNAFGNLSRPPRCSVSQLTVA